MSSNSEAKRPQPSEWWRTRGGEIRYVVADVSGLVDCSQPIISIDCDGDTMHHSLDGSYYFDDGSDENDLVEHLPECDSFDWVPEVYPQWYLDFNRNVVLKRTSTDHVTYYENSGESDSLWGPWHTEKNFKKLTEAEAIALLDKHTPVESPDDWVIQDRCEARPGVDEAWWSYGCDPQKPDTLAAWWQVRTIGSAYGKKNGHLCDGGMLNLRCRRKDLPPLPEAKTTRTVTFLEYVLEHRDYAVIGWRKDPPNAENWKSFFATGNIREIELPIDEAQ